MRAARAMKAAPPRRLALVELSVAVAAARCPKRPARSCRLRRKLVGQRGGVRLEQAAEVELKPPPVPLAEPKVRSAKAASHRKAVGGWRKRCAHGGLLDVRTGPRIRNLLNRKTAPANRAEEPCRFTRRSPSPQDLFRGFGTMSSPWPKTRARASVGVAVAQGPKPTRLLRMGVPRLYVWPTQVEETISSHRSRIAANSLLLSGPASSNLAFSCHRSGFVVPTIAVCTPGTLRVNRSACAMD